MRGKANKCQKIKYEAAIVESTQTRRTLTFRRVNTHVGVDSQSSRRPWFTEHISSVDSNIKFTREDAKGNKLPFLTVL